MAEKNGNGHDPKIERRPFKKGEREKHLELLAKHVLKLDELDVQRKRVKDKLELIKEDIRQNGYVEEAQGTLGIEPEDDDNTVHA